MKIKALAHEISVISNAIPMTRFKANQHRRDADKLDTLIILQMLDQETLRGYLKWELFLLSLNMTPKEYLEFAKPYWELL